MGKRQIGELEPSEFVVTILISELVAIPMQDLSVPLLAGVVPVLTILAVEVLISQFLLKNIKFRRIMTGRPSILVHNGKIVKRELAKNRISIDELVKTLRLKNVTDISTLQYAILETNGQLSTLIYPDHRPPTLLEQRGQQSGEGLPVIVISDGHWVDSNLDALKITRVWVEKQFKQRGISDFRDVFLMMVDEKRNVYLLSQSEALGETG
jgi:uncharacterized membrane protein YcaP (DUF421 family)